MTEHIHQFLYIDLRNCFKDLLTLWSWMILHFPDNAIMLLQAWGPSDLSPHSFRQMCNVLHLLNDGEMGLCEMDWTNGAWTSLCLSGQLGTRLAQPQRHNSGFANRPTSQLQIWFNDDYEDIWTALHVKMPCKWKHTTVHGCWGLERRAKLQTNAWAPGRPFQWHLDSGNNTVQNAIPQKLHINTQLMPVITLRAAQLALQQQERNSVRFIQEYKCCYRTYFSRMWLFRDPLTSTWCFTVQRVTLNLHYNLAQCVRLHTQAGVTLLTTLSQCYVCLDEQGSCINEPSGHRIL